jgi:hypothetical protein
MSAPTGLGVEFARALAVKDRARMRDLLHAEIDFRAMTPGRIWEADDPDGVIDTFLAHWFEDSDEIQALERIESDAFADRLRVGYRLRVVNPEGCFLVEQQAYLGEREQRIGWMRVMCSGYRPDDGA